MINPAERRGFFMNISERTHLEVISPLSPDMKPFRSGVPYLDPIFYSDGKKAVRAKEIGLHTAIFPRLAYVMDRGEKACHLEYRPEASGEGGNQKNKSYPPCSLVWPGLPDG